MPEPRPQTNVKVPITRIGSYATLEELRYLVSESRVSGRDLEVLVYVLVNVRGSASGFCCAPYAPPPPPRPPHRNFACHLPAIYPLTRLERAVGGYNDGGS